MFLLLFDVLPLIKSVTICFLANPLTEKQYRDFLLIHQVVLCCLESIGVNSPPLDDPALEC